MLVGFAIVRHPEADSRHYAAFCFIPCTLMGAALLVVSAAFDSVRRLSQDFAARFG